MMESLKRWWRMWADPTPRIERHACPTCGCRFTWHILPPAPCEVPDDLPVVYALHPNECTDCLVPRARKAHRERPARDRGRHRNPQAQPPGGLTAI